MSFRETDRNALPIAAINAANSRALAERYASSSLLNNASIGFKSGR